MFGDYDEYSERAIIKVFGVGGEALERIAHVGGGVRVPNNRIHGPRNGDIVKEPVIIIRR